jgi:hypothetical protein
MASHFMSSPPAYSDILPEGTGSASNRSLEQVPPERRYLYLRSDQGSKIPSDLLTRIDGPTILDNVEADGNTCKGRV